MHSPFFLFSPFYSSYVQSDFFGKGIFIALFCLSLLSWAVLIHKIWFTRRQRAICKEFERRCKKESFFSENLQRPKDEDPPYGEIYFLLKEKTSEVLEKNRFFMNSQGKEREVSLSRADMEFLTSHAEAVIDEEIQGLEKNLFILPTAITLAPFLGLLGTVWGILLTFSHLQTHSISTGNNAAVLAGLSMALSTTIIGLIIAIPALIAYNYLKSAHRDFAKEMEGFSHHLLSLIEIQYRKVE